MGDNRRDEQPQDLDAREFARLSRPQRPRRSIQGRVFRVVLVLIVAGFVLAAAGPMAFVALAVIAGLTAPAWSGWWRSRR